jgi:intein/homing endonuclease
VGDTKITMSDGTIRNIEDIVVGDLILTYDPETSLNGTGSVSYIESPIKDDIIEFILSNGTTIKATTEHPFWVINKGWASYSPERTMLDHQMNVARIEKEDILTDSDGNPVTLLDMKDNNTEFKKVYNILMSEGHHTYFANDILVHNKVVYIGGGGGAS